MREIIAQMPEPFALSDPFELSGEGYYIVKANRSPLEMFQIIEEQYFILEIRWTMLRQLSRGCKRDRKLLRTYLGPSGQIICEVLADDLLLRVGKLLDKAP